MAQETFGQIWNKLLLYAPGTPVPLAQQFVKNAYRKVLRMHYWSELLKEGQIVVGDEYSTGTVALTHGSATATITTGAWTDLENRTVRFSSYPDTYTITAVGGTSDEIATLDRVYEGEDAAAATFLVADYYVEFPADLLIFDDIRDYNSNWRLARQMHQLNYLDRIDARRVSVGRPVYYVAAPPRITAGVSYPRLEFWPRPSAGTILIYRYYEQPELTSNSSTPILMLEPEALVFGALAELALWPGTVERPNPYFSLDLHKQYNGLFEDKVHQCEMKDLEVSQRMLIYDDSTYGVPLDANWLQSHGIPL